MYDQALNMEILMNILRFSRQRLFRLNLCQILTGLDPSLMAQWQTWTKPLNPVDGRSMILQNIIIHLQQHSVKTQ